MHSYPYNIVLSFIINEQNFIRYNIKIIVSRVLYYGGHFAILMFNTIKSNGYNTFWFSVFIGKKSTKKKKIFFQTILRHYFRLNPNITEGSNLT